jgi:hypothetical protein
VCAERHAVAASVVAGTRPVAVAIVTDRDYVGPCGACLQVLSEFDPLMPVVLVGSDGTRPRTTTLDRLLPGAFRFEPLAPARRPSLVPPPPGARVRARRACAPGDDPARSYGPPALRRRR